MRASILHVLQEGEKRLQGVDSPRLSAELLLAEVLGCSRMALILERKCELRAEQLDAYDALVSRRERGEPVAYILGRQEFYGRDFAVT